MGNYFDLSSAKRDDVFFSKGTNQSGGNGRSAVALA